MARQGPTKGGRILVKLPFGETTKPDKTKKTPGKNQLVYVKENVAKFLGFKPVDNYERETVTIKTAAGNRTVTRYKVQGSSRRRSVTLILAKKAKIGSSPGLYKTINVPLGSGCTITQAVGYYKTLESKGVIGLRTHDGKRWQWGEDKDKT